MSIISKRFPVTFAGKSRWVKTFFLFYFLFCFAGLTVQAQPGDSAQRIHDTVPVQMPASDTLQADTAAVSISNQQAAPADSMDYRSVMERTLSRHSLLSNRLQPVALISRELPDRFNNTLFYAVLGVLLLLALLRFFYERYFNNLFRVFFNTSLRQSQLTDQLLQARQVSLFFNFLFVCAGGLYLMLVLRYYKLLPQESVLAQAGTCALALAVVYFFKMIALRFTGWLTGFETAAGTYLFIIFLINKIMGILLLPFVVVIAFGAPMLHYPALLMSLMMVGLLLLLRFLRSYGLLRREIKVSRFHFLVYMAGVEVLPLLLIYKAAMIYFEKNG